MLPQSTLQCCMQPLDAASTGKALHCMSSANKGVKTFMDQSTPRLSESLGNWEKKPQWIKSGRKRWKDAISIKTVCSHQPVSRQLQMLVTLKQLQRWWTWWQAKKSPSDCRMCAQQSVRVGAGAKTGTRRQCTSMTFVHNWVSNPIWYFSQVWLEHTRQPLWRSLLQHMTQWGDGRLRQIPFLQRHI